MKAVKGIVYILYGMLAASLLFLAGAGKAVGIECLAVQSGSMEPCISTGSVAVVDSRCTYGSIEEGDVIIFETGENRVMHRAFRITEEGIETKGDANRVTDGITTTRENFQGRMLFHIPFLGYVMNGKGRFFLIAGIFFSYLVFLKKRAVFFPDSRKG